MNWSHRILRRKNGDLQIIEVYYNDDGSLMGFGEAAVYASADMDEGIESLAEQVKWYELALGKPILNESDFDAKCQTCNGNRYLYDPSKDEGQEYTNCPSCNVAAPAGSRPINEKDGQRGTNLSIVDTRRG